MKRSNRLILLIGLFLAVVAFVGIALTLNSRPEPTPTDVVTEKPTVIATRDIALGTVVTGDMLKVEQRKVDGARKESAFESPELVIGSVVRRPITTGAQLEQADFAASQTLTQLDVPAGQRAIPVQVDQITGVGAIVKPGDYVDVVLGLTGSVFPVVTVNPDDDSITIVAGLNSTSVKVLIEGLQVIGTLRPPAAPPAEGAPAPSGEPGTALTGEQEIVILSGTAQQIELIRFAQVAAPDGSSIALALRSPKDFIDANGQPVVPPPADTSGVILKTLVDGGYGVLRPELVEAILPTQSSP